LNRPYESNTNKELKRAIKKKMLNGRTLTNFEIDEAKKELKRRS